MQGVGEVKPRIRLVALVIARAGAGFITVGAAIGEFACRRRAAAAHEVPAGIGVAVVHVATVGPAIVVVVLRDVYILSERRHNFDALRKVAAASCVIPRPLQIASAVRRACRGAALAGSTYIPTVAADHDAPAGRGARINGDARGRVRIKAAPLGG